MRELISGTFKIVTTNIQLGDNLDQSKCRKWLLTDLFKVFFFKNKGGNMAIRNSKPLLVEPGASFYF